MGQRKKYQCIRTKIGFKYIDFDLQIFYYSQIINISVLKVSILNQIGKMSAFLILSQACNILLFIKLNSWCKYKSIKSFEFQKVCIENQVFKIVILSKG